MMKIQGPYDPQQDARLEALIRQKFDLLTERAAPASLAPRVMAAIHARANVAWWQRSWLAWPRWLQLVFVPVLAGYAGLMIQLGGLLWERVDFSVFGDRLIEAVASAAGIGGA
jgi:hypothetical protein